MIPILLLLALQVQDPVQVRARLQEEAIRAGEASVLRVDVETDGERAQIGTFRSLPPGVELEGTRSFDQRQFGLPGGTRRFISREFVLRARVAGRFRIPSVEVTVDGRVYSTSSQLLTVIAAAAPAAGTSSESEGVVLRTWLDADTVTVGQQVTLEAEALFSPDARLRLRRAPEYEPPSPSGFWIQDVPDRGRSTTRLVGQDRYEVQRFTRILFPLAPGEYEIPPARMEYEVRRGLLYAPETRALSSEPLRLVVQPVPAARPEGYTGAVGRFTVRGWIEPESVPAGEATVLTVEVSGEGNVKALPPPGLTRIEDVDVFPPSEEAETEIAEGVLRGTKRFSWVLIPRVPGELEIPGVRYAFYDPSAGAFDASAVGPFALGVSAGVATPDGSAVPTIRYLDTSPGRGDPLGWVRSTWFAGLQLLPLLALALTFGWRRRGVRSPSRRLLRRDLRAELKALEGRAGEEGARLFADAERFARTWIERRLGIPAGLAGRLSTLVGAGVSQDTATALQGLLDRLSTGRYAPTPPGPEARRDLIRALGRLLERLDREAPATDSQRPGPSTAGAMVLAAVLGLGAAVPAPAQEPGPAGPGSAAGPDAFSAGVQAFDAERYGEAVDAFRRYTAERPSDAAGWYNLGTAYYREDRPGYATWAWLRVLALEPRHGDARHNLRVAGAAPELVARATPPMRLRSTELFLLAALAWLLTAVAGGIGLARKRRRAVGAAGAGFLLALALAAGGWASTRPLRTLIVVRETPVRAGPNLRADLLADLEPGIGLTPVERRGDWVRIRARDVDGWIELTATEPL